MKKKYLRALAKAAAVRAIKTVAQTAIATIGSAAFWGLLTGVSLSVHPPLLACCLC